MLMIIVFNKYMMYWKERWNIAIKSTCVENIFTSRIYSNQFLDVIHVFNFPLYNNCRKPLGFNLGD